MSGRLDGTVALVTGASSGIGEATALALAEQGASLALVARRAERLRGLADTIRGRGGSTLAIAADVSDEGAASTAVQRAVAEFGRLDTVVNSAGLMLLGSVVGADTAAWTRMVDVNVMGLMYVSHAALPHLLQAAAGGPREVADLVNISSVAGRQVFPNGGVYNATKFGVGAFSDALRQEVNHRHVRVSLVEPGATATELLSHNTPDVQAGDASRFEGVTRLNPADVADAVTYVVTRPRHVAVNEVLLRPTQE